MNLKIRPLHTFSFIFLIILAGLVQGQPVIERQNIPPGFDIKDIPKDQLPGLKDRVKQLRDAGVPESEILKRLQGQASGIPGITQPVSPLQGNQGQNNSSSLNNDPDPIDVIIEGDDPVLDEEDGEYQDKPKEEEDEYFPPRILSNVYGHKIFIDTLGLFEGSIGPNPAPDYIVGPGDVFTVTIWGNSELSESLAVASDGSVNRSYIGKIYLGGLTYENAVNILEKRYKNIVASKSNIEIFIGRSRRTINVNIVGEVFHPGSYRINAAIPAFNALFEAKGITDIGSVRNILIKRGGRTVQELDMYDYLIRGNDEPIYLQDNDFIYVPVQGKIAEVEGAVKRPMEYELKGGENLKALLEFAGGLNYDAMRSDAQVARLEYEREVLVNFRMDSILTNPNKDFRIKEGDKLIIRTLNKGAFNTVQAFGNLEYPGTYQLLPGEKVSDLISRSGGLGIDTYMDRAYIARIVPNTNEVLYIPINLTQIYNDGNDIHDLELQYFDALIVFSEADFRDERYISISGQVRKPGIIKLSPTMTLKDLLLLTGGPNEDADLKNIELSVITNADHRAQKFKQGGENETEGEIEGLNVEEYTDPEDKIVRRISINEDWRKDSIIDTLLIYEFDQVQIYSKYDFKNFKFIEVEGAVKNPGRFPLKNRMTIKDLLYLSGGLSEKADVNEIELYREISFEEKGNFGVNSSQEEIKRIRIEKNWQDRGGVIDSFSVEGFKKMVVRSSDEFFSQGFIEVKGLVNNPGRFEVRPNMTLLDIFYQTGGPKITADFDQVELSRVIEVISESGEIVPVPIEIEKIPVDQNWQKDSSLAQIKINSFDQVFVRKNPDFELQESVFVLGEVITPGEYNKDSKAELVSSLVARSGGITDLAYLEGAFIQRKGIGKMSIKLKKALNRRGSKFDIPLLEGDTLIIPPRTDVVMITGNVLQPGTTVLYDKGKKRFKYYVNQAGGFARKTKKTRSTAAYVDGRVKSVKRFLFFKKYPRIEQGTRINVARKPEKEKKESGEERNRMTLQEALATATSILTFLVLIDRLRSN